MEQRLYVRLWQQGMAGVGLGGLLLTGGLARSAQAVTFPNVAFECPMGSSTLVARQSQTVSQTPSQDQSQTQSLSQNQAQTSVSTPILQLTAMGNLSAEQRCREVAARFNFLNTSTAEHSLAYLTTGLRNNLPIVCSVPEYGAPCNQTEGIQLFTLNPRDRSPLARDQALTLVLIRLHNATASTPVLLDSQPALYVDLRKMLQENLPSTSNQPASSRPESQRLLN